MMLRRMALAGLGSAALIIASAGAASAGEVTGNGKDTPIRSGVASSVCAFSGLNNDAGQVGAPVEPGRTQSFGQLVRAGQAAPRFFNPGDACRGNLPAPPPPAG